MVRYVLCLIFSLAILSSYAETKEESSNQEYVYLQLVADRVGERCYPVRIMGSLKRKNEMQEWTEKKHEWTLFCGELTNFWIELGYVYPLVVEDYYPGIDTIHVIKVLNRFEGHTAEKFNNRVWSEYKEWKRKHFSQAEPKDANLESEKKENVYIRFVGDPIKVDEKLCYPIKRRSRGSEWELFCGVFENFYIYEGSVHTLRVEDFDSQDDTIHVKKDMNGHVGSLEFLKYEQDRVMKSYLKWKKNRETQK